jgi:hypothetical protein
MIRSPLDCLWSFFNMMCTQSHNKSIPDDKIQELTPIWQAFIEDEMNTWIEFHEYWTSSPQKVPTHIVRYEDLLSDPYNTFIDLFQFLMNRTD